MQLILQVLLVAQAFWELLRYDLVYAVFGFRGVHRSLSRKRVNKWRHRNDFEAMSRRAMSYATSFYWKQVLCLQRSVAVARVLRCHGLNARVAIGYRPLPFLSHAWVEIEGRVVNDSQALRQRLQLLDSF
jgi:hypothetical protein